MSKHEKIRIVILFTARSTSYFLNLAHEQKSLATPAVEHINSDKKNGSILKTQKTDSTSIYNISVLSNSCPTVLRQYFSSPNRGRPRLLLSQSTILHHPCFFMSNSSNSEISQYFYVFLFLLSLIYQVVYLKSKANVYLKNRQFFCKPIM